MTTSQCPCGSQKTLEQCCLPFIRGEQLPESPEQLMRSRYTAYSLAEIDYIAKTMRGVALKGFNKENVAAWMHVVTWQGLNVLNTDYKKGDKQGYVEFIARYQQNDQIRILHEKSEFKFEDGQWFYVNGTEGTLQRNDPCFCGSGKKFKKCCMS